MVDQVVLNDTLRKINASLNKRFEKDAALYISKQDEYEIKKNLCNGAYGGVTDIAKARGISHDIVVKVILRNAGVLDIKDINKFQKELKPIFEDADYRVLAYMMEDVLGNEVYMQKKVRHVLFSYYMSGITSTMRNDYWESETFDFDMEERTELFRLIMEKTVLKDPAKTLEFKWDFAQNAFADYPGIMKDKNVFRNFKDTLDGEGQKEFFGYLCKEMESPSIESDAYDFILINAYASYAKKAFDDVISQIKSASPRNFKQYIKVICKLFWTEKDRDTLLQMFDTIQRVFHSPYIKNHIKREINQKVWKAAAGNKVLSEERKTQIDRLMMNVEETDKEKYASFADVAQDLKGGTIPKSIAFFWVNIKSPAFEKSILDSFTGLDSSYLALMREAYFWLFGHSQGRDGVKGLGEMCERLAQPLLEFAKGDQNSSYYEALDKLWLENVMKFRLQGPGIKSYLFKKHFNKVKEWK